MTLFLLVVAGSFAGLFGAVLGLGGGIFLVPILTLIFRLPIRLAIGTSLMAVIATSAGVANVLSQSKMTDVKLAINLELGTTLGAVAGSLIAGLLSPRTLSLLFGIFLLLVTGYTIYRIQVTYRKEVGTASRVRKLREELFSAHYEVRNWLPGMAVSFLAGGVSGLSGVGGGFIKVPIMYSVMGVPLGVATATSNFMVGITASASVFIYYARGDIAPLVVAPTACGVFLGALIGARIYRKLNVQLLRSVLLVVIVYTAVHMIVKGLMLHVR